MDRANRISQELNIFQLSLSNALDNFFVFVSICALTSSQDDFLIAVMFATSLIKV